MYYTKAIVHVLVIRCSGCVEQLEPAAVVRYIGKDVPGLVAYDVLQRMKADGLEWIGYGAFLSRVVHTNCYVEESAECTFVNVSYVPQLDLTVGKR